MFLVNSRRFFNENSFLKWKTLWLTMTTIDGTLLIPSVLASSRFHVASKWPKPSPKQRQIKTQWVCTALVRTCFAITNVFELFFELIPNHFDFYTRKAKICIGVYEKRLLHTVRENHLVVYSLRKKIEKKFHYRKNHLTWCFFIKFSGL